MRIAIYPFIHIKTKISTITTLTIAFLIFQNCTNNSVNISKTLETNKQIGKNSQQFNSDKAYNYVTQQLDFGPRIPGSRGHQLTKDLIYRELIDFNWAVEYQLGEFNGFDIENIIGKHGNGSPWIIVGTHYDTRIRSEKDPDPELRSDPVPGANDGASGVAVLLELARVLPEDLPGTIWFVFFDGEDNGEINGREWIMGSRFFVKQLENKPDRLVIIDMIGDKSLNIHYEKNSDQGLSKEIWQTANRLGYGEYFIPTEKYSIVDDHIPFIREMIPSALIIDFDYPYWHTTRDTIDKISSNSLQVVGETLYTWLVSVLT